MKLSSGLQAKDRCMDWLDEAVPQQSTNAQVSPSLAAVKSVAQGCSLLGWDSVYARSRANRIRTETRT